VHRQLHRDRAAAGQRPQGQTQAALSLITTGFPEGPRRTRALGLYGATASVGLAGLLLAPRLLRESKGPRAGRRLDGLGAALITVAVAALVYAVSQAGITGFGSVSMLVSLALPALAATAFAVTEHRHADPLVRPALLRARGLRSASALMLLLGLWNGGEMLVLSLYLQQVLRMSPLAAGLTIAPQGSSASPPACSAPGWRDASASSGYSC
jgi:hypothetical protein